MKVIARATQYFRFLLSMLVVLIFSFPVPGEVYSSDYSWLNPEIFFGGTPQKAFDLNGHAVSVIVKEANLVLAGSVSDPTAICVNVFNDYDNDGTDDGGGEPAISTVTVTAYDNMNSPTPLTVQADGSYAFTPPDGAVYRIEVTGLTDGLVVSAAGATTVAFASVGTTVNVGLHRPEEHFSSSNVLLAVPCYVDGASNGANANEDVMVITPVDDFTGGVGNPNPTEYFVADHDQIGATFGVSYSRAANSILAAAFTKRHAAFGPSGTGAIYKIDLNGDRLTEPVSGTGVSTLVDLNTLFGANTAGSNPHPNAGTDFERDPLTYDAVGKTGLGGLALDAENNVLWTINLADRRLYEIPLEGTPENPMPPMVGNIERWPASGDLTGLTGLMGADLSQNIRPFGVKYYRGEVYIGLVYTAESTVTFDAATSVVSNLGDRSLLRGYVYKFDPAAETFTQVLTFPLDYVRGQALDFCGNNGQAEFHPWTPVYDATAFEQAVDGSSRTSPTFPAERVYPQPWLTDLDFDEDGKMIIGIRDRFADQHGFNNLPPNAAATNDPNTPFTADGAGDVLVASINTIDNTTYVLENNAQNGTNGAAFGPSTGAGFQEGPGGGEFFFDDRYRPANGSSDGDPNFPCEEAAADDEDPLLEPGNEVGHDEISLGGVFVYPGQQEVFFGAYDPINDFNFFNNAGIISLSTQDGSRQSGAQIYASTVAVGVTFAKGNGLGDVEGMNRPAPIEIGNRLWVDTDGNGRQDPGEDGINGVTVELYKDIAGTMTKVAETTTAANAAQGNGAFKFSASPAQTWMNGVTEVEPGMDYEIRIALADVQVVNALTTGFTTTGATTTNDPVTDVNDSDADNMGVIAFSTTDAGENNHGLDIGVLEGPPCDEKRLDWDVEDWIAGTTNATFPIGLTNVTLDIQATGFGTYEREEPIEGGFVLIDTDLPDDTEAFNTAQAMVGDGESLELELAANGDMTVSYDFDVPVAGLMFSVLDLDEAESVTITAENNDTPVSAMLSAANGAGPMSVMGNTATGGGTNSDNDSDGTLDVVFSDEVDRVILTFSTTSRVALSDLKICDAGMSLGNLVWNDVDNDGLVDVTGEPGLPNVGLKLFKDENSDGLPDDPNPVASAVTDGDGHYLFDDLNSGKYLVWIDSTNFFLNAPLDSFSTSLYTEVDPEGATDNNDNGLNTYRKDPAAFGIWSGTVMLSPGNERLMADEPDQGLLGSGNADDENSDLTVDFGVLKDSDFDGAANVKEGYGDRDGDDVVDAFDFDPAGYVYCQLTGEIVKGGTIELVGAPAGGAAFFEFDGSSGFYQFFINSVPGTYTIAYTPPPGFSISSDPDRQPDMGSVAGAFDPTPGSPDNLSGDDPVVLGFGDIDGGTVQLEDFTSAGNPYYLSFDLNPDPNNADPFIFNNNIPVTCACDIDINDVEIVCSDDDEFAVTVDVSWVNEDPEGGDIEVRIGGQSVTIDPGTDQTGTATSPTITLADPAFDVIVEVEFLNNGGCVATTLVDLIACTPSCDDNPETDIIGGQAWQDINNDGVMDPLEEGQANVQVLIYECDNPSPIDTVYTNAAGEWSSQALTGGPFRVEFSHPLTPWLDASFAGPDNGSNTQFVDVGDCATNYGLFSPSEFCQEDLNVTTPCFVSGDPLGGGDSQDADWVVSVPYPPGNDRNLNDYLDDGNPIGAAWGVAFQKKTNTLYFSAFMKRHSGFGTLGTGGVYAVDVSDPDNPVTTEFLDFDTDLGIETGTDPRISDPLPTDKNIPNSDAAAFDLVGKQSLGDIDFSEDGETMWVINLFDRQLYEVPVGTPAVVPAASAVTAHSIPDPGCLGGVFRPFAVKARRGLVYVGGVCTGETNPTGPEALKAYIYVHDPQGADGNFTEVLSFDLDFTRGEITSNFSANWRPWIDEWTDIADPAPDEATFGQTLYPQPMLSDIEFTDDGSMLIGLMDRFGHQSGNNQLSTIPGDTEVYEGISAGDILKACYVNGQFVLESNGTCDGVASTGANSGFGPGGGEFFWQDMYRLSGNNPNSGSHNEIIVGGLAIAPGTNEVGVPVFDPLTEFRAGGLIWFDTETGDRSRSYQIFGQDEGGRPATFGKAGVFGDLELYCSTPIPLQVGNYAWIDADGDGVQDACEMPIANLPVSLYDADGNLIASTLTDENGNYNFSSNNADDPTLNWVGVNADTALIAFTDYTIVFGTDGNGTDTFDPTDGTLTIGDSTYTVTPAEVGEGENPEQNDSDVLPGTVPSATGFPSVSFNTGSTTVNHDLDAGFEPVCPFVDLALEIDPICSAQPIVLTTLVDSIVAPDMFDYTWLASGDGVFAAADGNVSNDYNVATTYAPGEQDTQNGSVTLSLVGTSDIAPASCPEAADSILITVLKVDCGSFFWPGSND